MPLRLSRHFRVGRAWSFFTPEQTRGWRAQSQPRRADEPVVLALAIGYGVGMFVASDKARGSRAVLTVPLTGHHHAL